MNSSVNFAEIPASTYQSLRKACGLSSKSGLAAKTGLANSLASVLVKNEEDEPIGMGRVIGDGGCFCQIVDICVLPELQGKGIGKLIMEKLMEFISTLPDTCYVSLIADGNANRLYEKYGFQDTLPESRGMYFKVMK
ncbi:MAG: GNAT family N-acetyltransferase [Calditrichia bacterium]